MFEKDAVYETNSLQMKCEGLEHIQKMMNGFFEKFGDVHWIVDEYSIENHTLESTTVVFDFNRQWNENSNSQLGREWITVSNKSSLISAIKVDTSNS